jgi:hypothetical protein
MGLDQSIEGLTTGGKALVLSAALMVVAVGIAALGLRGEKSPLRGST